MPLLQKKTELLIATLVLVGTLCANAVVAHRQLTKLHANAGWVTHAQESIAALDRLRATVTDAETGQRGYLITGDPRFLAPYELARATCQQTFHRLRELAADSQEQLGRIDELQRQIDERLNWLAQTIRLRDERGPDAVRDEVVESRNRQIMDQVRESLDTMRREERNLLASQNTTSRNAYRTALLSSLLAALLGLIAVAAFVWLLGRHLQAVEESAEVVHEQRELLRATLVSIGDAVIATDSRGCVTLLNTAARRLTGWSEEDARGKPLETVFPVVDESTREVVEHPALRSLREGWIVQPAHHAILLSRDGAEWSIEDSAAPIRTPKGTVSGAIFVFREIGERKRQEAALRAIDRRKDEFLATLAHELRNPLAPLSNALEVWPLVESDHVQMEQLREIMERQVQQLTRLIDELLDVSRITRGKIELRRHPIDVALPISGAVETVQPLIAAGGLGLSTDLPDDPILVNGDVARLTQVFGNILHNAVKYTGRNGLIRITARRNGDHAVISIRDNGPGIPAPMLTRIFEMFEQIDQTLDRAHGGLGIGLTLVKRLVDLHGGKVEARSEGADRGSEFIVTLPLALAEVVPPAAPAGVSPRPADVPALSVLVVDDVHASAKTLALMLQSIGQKVSVIHEGPAAIDWVRAHCPDLVLMDIAMPGMDGYEVARRIRAMAEVKDTFLVALTGYGQEEDRRRAVEAGFNDHMTKPTSIDALEQLLRSRPESTRHTSESATPQ